MEPSSVMKDEIVTSLARLVNSTGWELKSLPGMVKRVITENMWPERIVRVTGEVARFNSFAEFVTTPPPAGLGTDIETLERLCRDDAEAITLLRQTTTRPRGGDTRSPDAQTNSNNVTIETPDRGNTRAYTLDRLSRERPDLYQRVVNKELTANAAAIEAGWRKRKVQLDPEPQAVVSFIMRHFNDEERAYIVRALLGLEGAGDGD
jgi:hypothetical protein